MGYYAGILRESAVFCFNEITVGLSVQQTISYVSVRNVSVIPSTKNSTTVILTVVKICTIDSITQKQDMGTKNCSDIVENGNRPYVTIFLAN